MRPIVQPFVSKGKLPLLDFFFFSPVKTKRRINKSVNETTGNHFEVCDEREFSFLFELQIP